jgi:hypothetical protein
VVVKPFGPHHRDGPAPDRSPTDHLLESSERYLRIAYELGREAVSLELSVLDLALAHQEALLAGLATALDSTEIQDIVRAGGEYFLESLASFDMVQRGYKEARQVLSFERRLTDLSRQLSTFVGDASLALNASESLDEMRRLASERVRDWSMPSAR